MSAQWYDVYKLSDPTTVISRTTVIDEAVLAANGCGYRAGTDPNLSPRAINASIDAKIEALETRRQRRAQREFMLTGDKTALQNLENEIAALRNQRI